MSDLEDTEIKGLLDEALWQVEEAKKLNLNIAKAMNFINLSKEAQGYDNKRLTIGLLTKARETLFSDMVDNLITSNQNDSDVVMKMRMERTIKEARGIFSKGDLSGSYDVLFSAMKEADPCHQEDQTECMDDNRAQLYSEALDGLQKVWLKMKTEEGRGKDMSRAKQLIKEAKVELSKHKYQKVMDQCTDIMDSIQSPQDKLKEEATVTIDEITRTLKALFPDQPRSPKERFFKRQIEELITLSKEMMKKERTVEAINSSRKAKEILSKLEQESIRGDIPKMIIELRAALDDLKSNKVDVSYEEYLLKQVEETFWKGEYIKARKVANKLESITKNARSHLRVNEISSRLTSLNQTLKEKKGKRGYDEAKELIEKAKIMLDQSAFDMAGSFLDKAGEALGS